MTNRVELEAMFPMLEGETPELWTDRVLRYAREHGTFRQCSIGWHEECSQRDDGPNSECMCICHEKDTWVYTVEGHAEDGVVVPTASDVGKQYWPPREGEPATMWAHWVWATDYADAERRAVAKQRKIMADTAYLRLIDEMD